MYLTKKQMKENRDNITSILLETERQGIDDLVSWLEGTDFFTAPASTKQEYHGAYEGGLAKHALDVYQAFEAKEKLYTFGLRHDERAISSICHDFCKIGQYRPNVLKSGGVSESKPYFVEDNLPFGHGEKSVLMASRHIELTRNEILLIRWHMGPFDAEWENYESRVSELCPAVYAFHNADMEASRYMDIKR